MSRPKNIVIFSDGTGNSGAKFRGTNVWRLFEALEVNSTSATADGLEKVGTSAPTNTLDIETCAKSDNWDQIALYDDGVGTSSFKPLKIIGGAFGWGISANLERMYRFLIRHYEPGDRIYLFGFSRGAFTIRTLSNILWYCGLPSRNGLTPDGIGNAAKLAISSYKNRVQGDREKGEPSDLRSAITKDGGHSNVPIWFIGAWDTVDAVGLPFDEMTEAFSWLMPLRLGESMHRSRDDDKDLEQIHEDDLHPLVQHAYHAMAIDDRRYTFHPMLFQDRFPVGCSNAGELKPIAAGDNPKLRQVWFAGMHSNVGGGYPQDALSLVSLQWMLNRIEQSAEGGEKLRFTNLVEDYQRDADPHGRIYDSRTGTGLFYRYRPRSIEKLHKSYGCHCEPRIHWSVLERIKARVDHYLPSMIPKVYEIEVPEQPAFTSQKQVLPSVDSLKEVAEKDAEKTDDNGKVKVVAESRYNAHQSAENHLMVGRWQYWLFVIFFISIIFMGWWGKGKALRPNNAILPESHSYESAILDLISAIAPSFITPGIDSFRNMPGSVSVAFAILLFLWSWSGVIVQSIQSINWDAWNLSFKSNSGLAPEVISVPPFSQDMKESLLKRYLHSSQGASGVGKAMRFIWKPIVKLFWIPEGVHLAAAKLVKLVGARWLDKWIDLFNWILAPKIVWFIVILFFVVAGFRISWSMRLASETTNAAEVKLDSENTQSKSTDSTKVESKTVEKVSMDSRKFTFDTRDPMFDSGFNVLKGERYVVKVNIERSEPWKDGSLPASPTGTLHGSWVHGISVPVRRSIPHPYFFLMASIGPKNSILVPIGDGNSFVAKADGRLYFFVNDGPADWIYKNNQGTAEIEITRF